MAQQGSARTWYTVDALGSLRQTLSDAGIPLGTASYDAWGVPQSNAIAPFGFTGALQRGSDGWLRARWDGAGRGSFASRDPYAGDAGVPYSLMAYQYAYSAPTLWTDASGEAPCAPIPGIPIGNCGGGGGGRGGPNPGPGTTTNPKPGPPGTAPYEPRLPHPQDGGGTRPAPLPGNPAPGGGGGLAPGALLLLLLGGSCLAPFIPPQTAPDTAPSPTPPVPNPTPTDQYIYRAGPDKPKTLSLHRPQDWKTGLSFFDTPPIGASIKFKVTDLTSAGYAVRSDGGMPVYELWNGPAVINPATGQTAVFPAGHVSVYYSKQSYWDGWHQADAANKGTPHISPQLQAIYNLRAP